MTTITVTMSEKKYKKFLKWEKKQEKKSWNKCPRTRTRLGYS